MCEMRNCKNVAFKAAARWPYGLWNKFATKLLYIILQKAVIVKKSVDHTCKK